MVQGEGQIVKIPDRIHQAFYIIKEKVVAEVVALALQIQGLLALPGQALLTHQHPPPQEALAAILVAEPVGLEGEQYLT